LSSKQRSGELKVDSHHLELHAHGEKIAGDVFPANSSQTGCMHMGDGVQVQHGLGCTLLIHEATFEAPLQEHAIKKKHSTTAEAMDVAKRMQVEYVILTHFSQRYPKAVDLEVEKGAPPFCTAFDGMHIDSGMFPYMAPVFQATQSLLHEDEEILT
jgi:hypothetical protein